MASVSSPPASIPCVNFSEIGQQPIRQLFLENGFLRVDGLFSGEEVAQMKAAMAAIVEGFDPAEHPTTTFNTKDEQKHVKDRYFLESVDKIRFFYEEGAVDQQQGSGGRLLVPKERALNKVGHALHWLDPVFRRFTFHERIKQLCLLLDVQSPRVVQSMYIFKQPRIGGDVDEHVDSTFLHTREPQNLLGIWIALDAAREENGCLWFAPGSHKDLASIEPNKRYKFVRNEDAISRGGDRPLLKFIGTKQPCSDGTNERHFVPVECESGSLLLIHGDVLHRSASNKSERPRHAYTFHLVDFGREGNGEWAESNWLQETEEYKFPELFAN